MKSYVQINSQVTINCTCGLQFVNKTNPNSRLENNLKIDPVWSKLNCMIMQGVHWYPAEVAEWHSVQTLIKNKLASLGEESDECYEPAVVALKDKISKLYAANGFKSVEEPIKVEEPKEEPKRRRRKVEEPVEEVKDEATSLEDIAGDEDESEEESVKEGK